MRALSLFVCVYVWFLLCVCPLGWWWLPTETRCAVFFLLACIEPPVIGMDLVDRGSLYDILHSEADSVSHVVRLGYMGQVPDELAL